MLSYVFRIMLLHVCQDLLATWRENTSPRGGGALLRRQPEKAERRMKV